MRKYFLYLIALPYAYKTKKVRKQIYLEALEYYKSREERCMGFCVYFDLSKYFVSLDNLPELFCQKPPSNKCAGSWWFRTDTAEGVLKRRECLEKAIKMCN